MRFGVSIIGEQPIAEIVSHARLAEDLGYESFWIADSQLLCRELYVTLSACALNTSRINLGAGVTAPYTRHVSVTASAFATLNELAEGRLRLGISNGNSLVRTIGHRPARVAEVEEYVGQLTELLDNRTVGFERGVEGKIAWMDRPSDIPIYVAGSGPKLIRGAARIADGVIFMVGVAPALLEKALAWVEEGAREAGKGDGQIDVIAWVPASVAGDGALARKHVAAHVIGLLRRMRPEEFDEQDREVVKRITEGGIRYPHGADASAAPKEVPNKFVEMLALAGDPDEVREQVGRMMGVRGFDTIVLNTQVSGPGFPPLESVMRDFAEDVMAHVA